MNVRICWLGDGRTHGEDRDPAPAPAHKTLMGTKSLWEFCRWISPGFRFVFFQTARIQLLFSQLVNTFFLEEWAVNYTVLPIKINVTFRNATYPEAPNKVTESVWIGEMWKRTRGKCA